jgi:hypothetical protein
MVKRKFPWNLSPVMEILKFTLFFQLLFVLLPYEFNFTIKITDMNQLINDLKTLVRNNWKTILWIVLVVLFVSNYDDIKSGILDGWNDAK